MTTSLIIGFDKSESGDNTVLIVGRKTPGEVCEILNAFEGKEAEELYERLVTQSKYGRSPKIDNVLPVKEE